MNNSTPTNGRPRIKDDHWQAYGLWQLWTVLPNGRSEPLQGPGVIYRGFANDANKFASKIAESRGIRSWFLFDVTK